MSTEVFLKIFKKVQDFSILAHTIFLHQHLG
jgi:hypothetical protein